MIVLNKALPLLGLHNVQDNVPLPLFQVAMNSVLTSPCHLPCRAPWRLAVYYLQSRDERILPLLQAQLRFFEGQKLISAGYKLDGTALADYSNIAFQAPVWCLFKVRVYSPFNHSLFRPCFDVFPRSECFVLAF